ncbi:MAG: hypothetical protein HY326_09030 [Chloroflexi bacterium]|nr:hypothetical protein [Chloroflexota bacterium]
MGIVRTNRMKQKLKQKQPVFDARITILDPELVEIAGMAGVDTIWIDGEHNNFDWERAQACVLAAELHGITPILRPTELPGYREYMIQRALNIGFQGMVVTGVRSPADMEALLDVMKFPPQGKRGVGEGRVFERAGEQVHRGPEILQALNAEIFTAVLIESVAGVNTIDGICALGGVDAVGLGHRDYALDAGLPDFSMGQEGMQAALRTINAAARKHGKAWFGDGSTIESFKRAAAEGALLFSIGRETKVWQKTCMNVTQYRSAIGS